MSDDAMPVGWPVDAI